MAHTNKFLTKAQTNKKDEFYTLYETIEKELIYYKEKLKGKVVYCNCDNPKYSNFYKYFKDNFDEFGLQELIATYKVSLLDETAKMYSFDGENENIIPLTGNGDFMSGECVELLEYSDVVITNPPFSKFRELYGLIVENDKEFLLLCNQNCVTLHEVLKDMIDNKVFFGKSIHYGGTWFKVHDDYNAYAHSTKEDEEDSYVSVPSIRWLTNMIDDSFYNYTMEYDKEYTPSEYPKYDTFDAIEVGKTKDIPKDYYGAMGVPVTFLDRYTPKEFKILGMSNQRNRLFDAESIMLGDSVYTTVNGKKTYVRVFIQRKKPN